MQTVDISDPSELFETCQQDTPITVELDPTETQSLDESELVLPESSGTEEQAAEQPESPEPENPESESSEAESLELGSPEPESPEPESLEPESPERESSELPETYQSSPIQKSEEPFDDALADFERKRMEIESALKDDHPNGEL